jgi:hypothetical protein
MAGIGKAFFSRTGAARSLRYLNPTAAAIGL